MPARVYFPDWLEDVFADLPPREQDAIFEKFELMPLRVMDDSYDDQVEQSSGYRRSEAGANIKPRNIRETGAT